MSDSEAWNQSDYEAWKQAHDEAVGKLAPQQEMMTEAIRDGVRMALRGVFNDEEDQRALMTEAISDGVREGLEDIKDQLKEIDRTLLMMCFLIALPVIALLLWGVSEKLMGWWP